MTRRFRRTSAAAGSSIYFRRLRGVAPARMSDHLVQPDLGEAVATAYHQHYNVLEYIAVRRFHVPDDDVQGIIHDVFVAFIRNRPRIRDERAWLVGATFTQCRIYWRARGGEPPLSDLEDDIDDPGARASKVEAQAEVSNVLGQLSTRCRELLHLRFIEQYSSQEIARQFATTVDYARKLVHRCVLNARALVSAARRERP